ncbi:MAG: division/cell wall cluster transcriptional repressor MraZ [Clostridia bacterium]|nr:division/cell wall cluster transcriptional repressor MraZ [Clostridia bacterium]
MLTGKHQHSIDAKNRLIIPAKLKEQLGGNITIIKDSEKCLCVYSEEEWKNYTAKFNELTKSEAKAVARYIYSNAIEVQPDSQGRVLLPQAMIDFAGITKNVITVGCGKYAEIWAEERWIEQKMGEEPENYAETLARLGL